MEIKQIIDLISNNTWWILGAVFTVLLIQVVMAPMGIRYPVLDLLSKIGLDFVLPVIVIVIGYTKLRPKEE